MNCPLIESANGQHWECPLCGVTYARQMFPLPPAANCYDRSQPRPRESRTAAPAAEPFKPLRTDGEVLYIATSFCAWCRWWQPENPTKKCRLTGCSSCDFLGERLPRRTFECPLARRRQANRDPAAWSNSEIQRQLELPPQRLEDALTSPPTETEP